MPSALAKYLILLQKHKLNSAYFQELWLAQPTTHFAFILYTYSNKKYSIYGYCQLMVFMIDDKADMVMPPGDNIFNHLSHSSHQKVSVLHKQLPVL